jgi:hypothetical protein
MKSCLATLPCLFCSGGTALILYDDLDDAVIGVTWKDGEQVSVYSADAIVEILMSRDEMTEEDALEHISYNIEGGYLGPLTPVIVWAASCDDIRYSGVAQ